MGAHGKTSIAARAAIIATVTAAAAPVALLGLWSFAKGWYWPALLPREWSPRAWTYAAAPEAGIAGALASSVLIALLVTALSVAVAIPAGRALAHQDFPGKRAVLFLLLAPVLAPPLAAAMGVHALFLRIGLAETSLGIVLVHLIQAAPYATLMLTGSFSHFDPIWEAQARTLGASPTATWLHVTLPAITPGLSVAAAFSFLISWSQYLLTLLIGGGRVITLPLLLVNFQRGGDESVTAALSLIYLMPAVLVFVAVARFLTERESGA
ncbi:MAG TPA: ABC transporter permease subunit [Bryobacteraceae bacterium]|jgi:putative spermidine/putrescine transport system permease protein|nr:ABC transporter permease subunit [Bryobacteraceae bacterium]